MIFLEEINMHKFELIDPNKIADDIKLIKKFDIPCYKGSEDFFLKKDNHIIIYSQKWMTLFGNTELAADQIEIPASAIQWIIDTIEIKFFKPPSEGGLPADKFHHKETIEGELLKINRGVATGGEGIGGYRLLNLSRKKHTLDTWNQEYAMPDPFLFEYGLMDFLKEIADKIKKGAV
jgi:hypothetical protein